MHIKDSTIALASTHHLEAETTRQFLLGRHPSEDSSKDAGAFERMLGKARQAAEPQALALHLLPPHTAKEEAPGKALQEIIQMLFGRYKAPGDAADAGMPEIGKLRSLPRLELVHTREMESCSFSASGNICLADGSTREFDVSYSMERSEENTRLSVGDKLRDPLVLDFGAPSSKLGTHSVDFDLDADGQAETMRMPAAGAAFLFHDLNRNGKADDGRELFGPQSGNGFAELAKLDSDGNWWIDAGDAAYADLMLWHMGDDGVSTYQSLAAAGIGALSTRYEDTPFTIKENGEVVGQVRGSSVWLGEESGAGIVRQIDIATAPLDAKEATQAA
jgi:hypothetical protein